MVCQRAGELHCGLWCVCLFNWITISRFILASALSAWGISEASGKCVDEISESPRGEHDTIYLLVFNSAKNFCIICIIIDHKHSPLGSDWWGCSWCWCGRWWYRDFGDSLLIFIRLNGCVWWSFGVKTPSRTADHRNINNSNRAMILTTANTDDNFCRERVVILNMDEISLSASSSWFNFF